MTEPRQRITDPAPASAAPDVIHLPPPKPERKGGGRRPAADPATEFIKLRVTPAIKAIIEQEADRAGLTVTAYLLQHVPGTPRPMKKRSAIADRDVLVRLLGQIGRLGGNHMQLTHAFNATGETPGRASWERQEQDIQAMRQAIMQALGYGD
jgi:hypothetical protein